MPTEDIDLLLILGAGASTAFGNNREPLAMMPQFSDAIHKHLSNRPAFQDAIGLTPGLSGYEFERRLGVFLRAVRVLPDIESVLEATSTFPNAQIEASKLTHWHKDSMSYLRQIVEDIYTTTYEQFSPSRVAISSAQTAYRSLLDALRIRKGPSRLVVATTNYDLVADTALEENDWNVDNGSRNAGSRVDMDGLLDGGRRTVPILHLHGCLGWYRREGNTRVTATNNPTLYDPGYGEPVVLLPDPDKDYQGSDPLIQRLWTIFGDALSAAKRVLIIGHSLNDPALVQLIGANLDELSRMAVTVLPDLPSDDPLRTTRVDPRPLGFHVRLNRPT